MNFDWKQILFIVLLMTLVGKVLFFIGVYNQVIHLVVGIYIGFGLGPQLYPKVRDQVRRLF